MYDFLHYKNQSSSLLTRYNVSKLIEMYGVQELAELQSASQKEGHVVINHVNPGWVVTEVMREWTGLRQTMFKISSSLIARKTEVGARTLVNAAEGGEETYGQYMDDCRVGKYVSMRKLLWR